MSVGRMRAISSAGTAQWVMGSKRSRGTAAGRRDKAGPCRPATGSKRAWPRGEHGEKRPEGG